MLVLDIPGRETRNGLCEDLELGRGIDGGQMSLGGDGARLRDSLMCRRGYLLEIRLGER